MLETRATIEQKIDTDIETTKEEILKRIGDSSDDTVKVHSYAKQLEAKSNIMLNSNRVLTMEVNRTLSEAIYNTEENVTTAIRKESLDSLERDNILSRELNSTTHDIENTISQKEEETKNMVDTIDLQLTSRLDIVDSNITSMSKAIATNKNDFDEFYKKVNEALFDIDNNFKEIKESFRTLDNRVLANYESIGNIELNIQDIKTIQLKQEQRDIGTLVWAYECDDSIGLYELDGSKYQDEKLADYLFLKDLDGFSVEDDVIDTPNLKGRFLGYAGALGVGSVGSVGADKTAVNGLNIQIGIDKDTGDGDNYKYWASGGVAHPAYGFTTMDNFFYNGDTETLPNWYALKLCIKGEY